MGRIDTLAANFKSIDVSALYASIIDGLRGWIVDQNFQEQLFEKGIDARGERLPGYSITTIKYKEAVGQPTDRTTLKDTGDFYSSGDIEYKNNDFELIATDSKTGELMSVYGADILGLTDENIDELIEKDIKPQIIEDIRNAILT